jgi:hypothetical protein
MGDEFFKRLEAMKRLVKTGSVVELDFSRVIKREAVRLTSNRARFSLP